MILSFKQQFKEKILSGEKIHTIREDLGRRWQPEKESAQHSSHYAYYA
jgi:hypothetical protein